MDFRFWHRAAALLLSITVFSTRAQAADTFSIYGFLIPSWLVGSNAVESFSQPNLSAYTAAANPALATADAQVRTSFQVAQSRFGFLVHPVADTTGRMEFDFIDFTKASPTTASVPRVRRALIEYAPSEHFNLKIGQDWDLISPLAPHGFNYVGHYFESGDIAFMRWQVQAVFREGDWEHGFALGLPSNNSIASDGLLELGAIPTLAVREAYHFGRDSQVGVSGIAATLRSGQHTSDHFFAGAVTGFVQAKLGESTELRSEAYVGQNTYNLGLLGLAFANANTTAVKEAGAYVSVQTALNASFNTFVGLGGSWILNTDRMLASYTRGAGNAALAGTGPGLESNWTARAGAEWKANEKTALFAELAGLFSTHRLIAADAGKWAPKRTAAILQVGAMLNF